MIFENLDEFKFYYKENDGYSNCCNYLSNSSLKICTKCGKNCKVLKTNEEIDLQKLIKDIFNI